MDFGYKAEEIVWLVESGILTLGYQSSSYLTDRVPELSFVDLPFLFGDNDTARARDGRRARPAARAGDRERSATSASSAGTRTASATSPTGCAPIRTPADLKGMHIRVLPSQIQERTFELLGATPHDHGPHRRDPR